MARIVPSQAVALIDSIFPWAKEGTGESLPIGHSDKVAVIVEAIEQIPSELITIEENDFLAYLSSLRYLKHALEMWPTRGHQFEINYTPGFRKTSPLTLLRSTLAKCADDAAASGTSELQFITDDEFRESLRRDVSIAHSALSNAEWKPCTVIAGSVVEALLLWALQQGNSADVINSATSKHLFKKSPPALLEWTLYPLIEVADDLKVINPDTANQCRLARGFRNLIHPGKAERLKTQCNRATALSAVAAMAHVIDDLT